MSNDTTPPKHSRRTHPHQKHSGYPGMWIVGLIQNAISHRWVPIGNDGKPGDYPPNKPQYRKM